MKFPPIATIVCLVLLLMAAGCNGRSYKVASPVIGPVPPRVSTAESKQNASNSRRQSERSARGQSDNVEQVAYSEQRPLLMTEVIAEVNGEPILAHEVLDRYAAQLDKAKGQLKPEQIRQAQMEMIKKDLPNLIEQTLMVDSVKTTMKPEQLKSVEDQLDKHFEGEVKRLMQLTGTNSPAELESALQAQGVSLAALRKSFGDRQLAGQYLRTKMGKDPTASRAEMRARYEQDIETYTEAEELVQLEEESRRQHHRQIPARTGRDGL